MPRVDRQFGVARHGNHVSAGTCSFQGLSLCNQLFLVVSAAPIKQACARFDALGFGSFVQISVYTSREGPISELGGWGTVGSGWREFDGGWGSSGPESIGGVNSEQGLPQSGLGEQLMVDLMVD